MGYRQRDQSSLELRVQRGNWIRTEWPGRLELRDGQS